MATVIQDTVLPIHGGISYKASFWKQFLETLYLITMQQVRQINCLAMKIASCTK